MDIGIISSRYARALFKFAAKNEEKAEVYKAMTLLGQTFEEVPALRDTLQDPMLTDEKKMNLLNVASGNPSCKSLREFFKLVLKNKRIDMMHFMTHSFIDTYRKQQHLIHSNLTVSSSPDSQLTDRLKTMVKHKTNCDVEFVIEQDPSLIGGFVLEYDTYRFDASIKGRLQNIKKQLLESNN